MASSLEYRHAISYLSIFRRIRKREFDRFIKAVEKLPEKVTEFDEALWGSLIDHLTVNAKDNLVFTLTSWMEIKA